MLTILGDGQPFLGVNVPHLDCVGCGMSEGELSMSSCGRSFERIEIPQRQSVAFFGGVKITGCASLKTRSGLAYSA